MKRGFSDFIMVLFDYSMFRYFDIPMFRNFVVSIFLYFDVSKLRCFGGMFLLIHQETFGFDGSLAACTCSADGLSIDGICTVASNEDAW